MKRTNRSNRTLTLVSLLSAAGLAAVVGCSSDTATTPSPQATGATGGTTATGGTGGTPYMPAAGSGGTTTAGAGGTTTAGSGGGGTGGTGGVTGGTGGTGGVYVPPPPYCEGKTHEALPYTVNSGFQLSGWSNGAVTQAVADTVDGACGERVPGAVGGCSYWTFTPDVAAGAAFVQWITKWDAGYTHPPVCIDEDAAFVTFVAKGDVGGEVVTFAAGNGLQDVEVTLTTEWVEYSIPLDGVMFNSNASGVTEGFVWKIVPTADTVAMNFYIDNIQWVAEVGGGAGGAGGGDAGGAAGAPAAAGSGGTP